MLSLPKQDGMPENPDNEEEPSDVTGTRRRNYDDDEEAALKNE